MIKFEEIVKKTANALVEASTTFRPDQLAAYERAFNKETNSQAKWILENVIENANAAKTKKLPLCDDTGVPHVFLEIGEEAEIPTGLLKAIEQGVAVGLREVPCRPMAVLGDDIERIEQSVGLSEDPGDLSLAPIQIKNIPGDKILLTVLMLGGGPEIRGKTQRVFHKHSIDVVVDEMVNWATEGAQKLGCLPTVLGFGIGRTNVEAASLALEAMRYGDFSVQSEIEQKITNRVNESGYGALGLGGDHTAIATFLKVGAQRASGIRVVSLRVGCCFDPRRATVEL